MHIYVCMYVYWLIGLSAASLRRHLCVCCCVLLCSKKEREMCGCQAHFHNLRAQI